MPGVDIHQEWIKILITARNEATAAMTEAGTEAKGLQATLTGVGQGLIKAGSVVGAVSVGLGLGVVALTKAGADFQTQTTALVTGAGESARALGSVQKGILAL